MMTSTRRALRPWGARKALTPFDIASRPVSDDPPFANERSTTRTTTKNTRPDLWSTGTVPTSACGSYRVSVPEISLMIPTTMTANIAAVKA